MTAALITRSAQALLATALLTAAGTAQAATDYSDNPLAPTPVSIGSDGTFEFEVKQEGLGAPTFACAPGKNCKDYVTFTVPAGRVLNGLKLKSYDSTDDRVFVAIQAGTQFTATPVGTTLPGALAYNHAGWRGICAQTYGALRPNPASANNNCIQGDNVTPVVGANTNLFKAPSIGGSPLAVGFLPAGDYSVWLQQVSGVSEYTFVGTTAVPGPLPAAGALAGLAFSRRLRRRLQASADQA
ncbi:MAG: hypothetical protein K9J72_09820 [Synechococcus sp. Tobar2m-G35]|nr:hypothetical protein [Synechococcus sp. Tobar2m-G35]